MKRQEIKFLITTIAPKRSIDDSETDIGYVKANMFTALAYLSHCGIYPTRQSLYKVKGSEYLVPQEKSDKPFCNPQFIHRREYCRINEAPIHLRVERLK